MLRNSNDSSSSFPTSENGKRKRRPAGTPDPDAEVVYLSPSTLLESDKYICEICNQGFQRDQNLQMHRRRHKVPWKLIKRKSTIARKRVYVCPEPSCVHHDPCHALGDLVGIKKHFRRKHSNQKQWVCDKCSKGYAVQSDYKAHIKTCGTRGHSCDCGRVFSRVESFIEHQDVCSNMGRTGSEIRSEDDSTHLQLSIGMKLSQEDIRIAMEEKTYADMARLEAKWQMEMAEQQFADAKRIRQEALSELEKARVVQQRTIKQVKSIMSQITCNICKQKLWSESEVSFTEAAASSSSSDSIELRHISAALRQWEFNQI